MTDIRDVELIAPNKFEKALKKIEDFQKENEAELIRKKQDERARVLAIKEKK